MTFKLSNRFKRTITPYVFISPFYIAFLTFAAFPIFYSFFISFHRWNGIRAMKWNWIENYTFVLTDGLFWKCLLNTVVIGIIVQIPMHSIALVCAYCLSLGFIKFKNFFKTTFMLPHLTSVISIALVFAMLYGTQYGLFNQLLYRLQDIPVIGFFFSWIKMPVRWLEGYFVAKTSVAMLAAWKWIGWTTILYVAGLQAIPESIYEAAKIDGASNRDMFFRISLPLLKPMLYFSFTMSLIGALQMFDEPFILFPQYSGGAANTCMTSVLYIYRISFAEGYFGTAAAASYILFVIIIIANVIKDLIFKDK